MTREEAFVRAVCDSPDDDAPRLVYADWLDEQGDADRAEFIRLQCELARMPEEDDRRWLLEVRQAERLRAHGKHWAGPVRRLVKRWQFRRGFVEGVTLPATRFLDCAAELFRAAPVRQVRFLAAGNRAGDLASCPDLARLSGIDLRHQDIDVPRFLTLARSPHFRRVTALNLRGTGLCSAAGLRALAGCPSLADLTTLDLSDNRSEVGVNRAQVGRHADHVATYRRRRETRIDAAGMQALGESPHLARLTELRLANYWDNSGYGDHFIHEVLAALADAPLLGRLTALDLRETYCGHNRFEPLGRLFQSPRAARLRALDLTAVGMSREQWQTLFTSPHLTGLTTLALGINFLSFTIRKETNTVGIQALASATNLARLRTLDLNCTCLDRKAVEILAHASGLPRLACLRLDRNPIDRAAVDALAGGPLLARLRKLSLQGAGDPVAAADPRDTKGIGPEGAEILAQSPAVAGLVALDLGNQRIGDAGARALTDSPHLAGLRVLGLWNNRIGAEGAAALLASRGLGRLSELDLRSNPVPRRAREQLRRSIGHGVRYGPGPSSFVRRWDWDEA